MKDPRAPEGFSFAERRTWRTVIFSNVVAAMRQVITAMEDFEIDLEHDNNLVPRQLFVTLTSSPTVTMSLKRKRSRILKVFRYLIFNHYKRYGSTAAFNRLFVEGMNMLYMIMFTSAHPRLNIQRLMG